MKAASHRAIPVFFLSLFCLGCAATVADPPTTSTPTTEMPDKAVRSANAESFARVEAIEVRGPDTFAVTIRSPDTGCEQYADWWEMLAEDGELLYRRVLAHSHVDEQPFTRTGGPVQISENQTIIVRAHMHPIGYGPQALRGTIAAGFEETTLAEGFAAAAAADGPQPPPCAF